jgi:Spy/CpxP family protein refolding chaperone
MVVALVLAVLTALAGTSFAQCGGHGKPDGRMGPGGPAALKPAFTTEQQSQIEKIRAKYDDQRVDLRNKMAVIRLEMRDLLSQPEPDFTKVEARIDAMSELHAKLAKMRLAQHKEIRGLLTPDQRALFDRGLAEGCCEGPGGPMGCGMMGGGTMGCGPAMGAGGAPGCGMAGAKGCGMAGAKGCGMAGAKGCGMAGAKGCAGMMGASATSCPMTGGAVPMRSVRRQAGEWRRWL